jgi:PIN domain nuclease of toxin-antitoxin system
LIGASFLVREVLRRLGAADILEDAFGPDRAAAALGSRLNADVWTADSQWNDANVRVIR